MNKWIAQGTMAVALTVAAVSAQATVTLTSVDGQWVNAQGGDNVTGEGTSQIRWGYGEYYGKKSGYGFSSSSSLPEMINGSDEFVLGTMTHYNRPITGDAIESVSLNIMADFSGSGDNQETGPYSFLFSHEETPNVAEQISYSCFFIFCWKKKSYDGDVDDVVYLDETITSSAFQLGNKLYSMELLGFDGYSDHFETAEMRKTSIDLLARLNVEEVPEPGTLALLGLGLAGLGAARRRKG